MRRLLITLQLCERGILPAPLLYLLAFFKATRPDYYAGLRNVSQNADWKGWLHYIVPSWLKRRLLRQNFGVRWFQRTQPRRIKDMLQVNAQDVCVPGAARGPQVRGGQCLR